MTVTLIVLLVVLFLALLFIPFMRQIAKDKVELSQTTLPQKFETLFATINAGLMGGNGELTTFDDEPRLVNMMDHSHPNMLIQFYYSTANLSITLNYKFFQKELVWKKDYPGLRNITIFQQKDIANDFTFESSKRIREHQQNVSSEGLNSPYASTPMVETDTDEDPTAILTGMYRSLTLSQKQSIANLMYMIGAADSCSEKSVIEKQSFGMQLMTMRVKWDDCKQQYMKYGEQRVFEDLKNIEEGIMTQVILAILPLVVDEVIPGNPVPNPIRERKFFESFAKLGYSEEKIENMVQKIMLLSQHFGMG
jgi:hypothetical protein